jgi:hypothetical protein
VKTYRVSATDRRPLIEFMTTSLKESGCRLIYVSPVNEAPFKITFETQAGERLGIVVYAFLANSKPTKNRPKDEHRFQMKYGSKKDGSLHELWQDPFGLYTTLLVGINPDRKFFVGADPVLHNPTRLFISIEFKQRHAEEILRRGWYAWERVRGGSRPSEDDRVEVLVGGTADSFLRYIRFEREALGEDQGHRQLLAERDLVSPSVITPTAQEGLVITADRLHELAKEFELSETEILDEISNARRLRMAVRGWVAERHLQRHLLTLPGVVECQRLDAEGSPDIRLRLRGAAPVRIECKNVLRTKTADGSIRLDFQRTRASKKDPCSRYYQPSDFEVVAACLHAVTLRWEYQYALTSTLDPHTKCKGRLSNNVRLDARWKPDAVGILEAAAAIGT